MKKDAIDLNQASDEMAGYIRGKRDTKEESIRLIKELIKKTDEIGCCYYEVDAEDAVSFLNELIQKIEKI